MRSYTGTVQEVVRLGAGREAGLAQVRREASQSRMAYQPLILKDRCQPIRWDTGYFPLRHAVNTSLYARGLLPAGHGLRGKYPRIPASLCGFFSYLAYCPESATLPVCGKRLTSN